MEFQFCSLTIEERYPRAVDPESTLDELRLENGHRVVTTCTIDKKTPGCVALLWGRTAEGASVCVRVEGVRPVLFFELASDETLRDLRGELEKELAPIRSRGDTSLVCVERTFCHFMGYEPDPTTASRRREHRYAEVSYPSLATWRLAVRLRKHQDIVRLRDRVRDLGRADAELRASLERLRIEASRSAAPQLVKQYRETQAECERHAKVLELYSKRLASNLSTWEDFDNEHGRDSDGDGARTHHHREAHEWFVDPTTRFLQENDLIPSRWIRVERPNHTQERVSVCDLEVQCDRADLVTLRDRDDNAPLKTCYYDIETTGLEAASAEVIQVSLVFRQGDTKKRVLVASRDHASISGVVVYAVATEADVLLTMQRVVLEEDPDSLVSYNGVNFDNPFLHDRAVALDVDQFFYLSRLALKRCHLRELKLQSSGMGDNLLRYFDTPGRSNYDWYVKLKRDLTQEDSYKLDYMAKKFCGKSKVELASGLKWRRMTATMDRDPAYELAECDRLVEALHRGGGGRAVYELTQDEWRAVGLTTPLVEHHWVRAGDHCYAPMNTKHRAIVDLYNGTSEDRARLGYYCVEDSEILDDLDTARAMLVEIYQFSGVFGIVPEWVYFRGQQVRFVSQILRKARVAEATPLLMNRPPDGFQGEDRGGFEGAVVNEPLKGFHKAPTGTLDWKSLYPSIMISSNLCHSTCVIDPSLHDLEGVEHYDVSSDYRTHFVSKAVHRGILPQILEELAVERTNAKGLVKRALKEAQRHRGVDETEYRHHVQMSKVYDGRQLAIKVAMNSIYGACGTSVDAGAKFPCLDISATVTFVGRQAMGHLRRILSERFPGIVIVYGDSVADYTPLLLRKDGATRCVFTPRDLWSEGVPVDAPLDSDKEVVLLDGWETWTEQGWTSVTTLIRHACRKRMFRVTTHTGTVDVTEDHSLLLEADASKVRPDDLAVGETRLLHSFPDETVSDDGAHDALIRRARICGMFIGDGSCNSFWYPKNGYKYSWAINNADRAMLQTYSDMCALEFESEFKILDTIESSGVYKLVPVGSIKKMVVAFRDICYINGEKTIPSFVLNGTRSVMTAFIGGIYDADGCKDTCDGTKRGGNHRDLTLAPLHAWQAGSVIDQTSERISLGLYTILRTLGYNVSIGTRDDKLHMYRIRFTRRPLRREATLVKRITPLPAPPADAYVYDLTTANHHFHAGVGQMIVHNTDSVMIMFPGVDEVDECGRLCEEAAEYATEYFQTTLRLSAMVLEFEKIFRPYLLEGKKRYIGLKFEPDGAGGMVCKGIDAKGVETERKDTLPYVKVIMREVRDALILRRDEAEALACFRRRMDDLVDGNVPIEMLTLKKNLSSKVAGKTDQIVQARVNHKRREREAGSEAQVNEQVEYVILNEGHRKSKTTDLAEDPVYAKEHGLRLNYKWYFEHCIRDAMKKMLEYVPSIDYAKLTREYTQRLEARRMGVQSNVFQSLFATKRPRE